MRVFSTILSFICIYTLYFSELTEAKDSKINIRLYKQNNNKYYAEPIEEAHLLFTESTGYNKSLPIVLLIHGMSTGADSSFVNGIIDAFDKRELRNDFNVFALDMPELFENSIRNDLYIGVLANVQPAGNAVGHFFNEIISSGLTVPGNINIIGYSIGAQIAGYIARTIKEVHGEISFIVGLDPAGPGFHTLFGKVPGLTHVSKADAKITHFLHTNSIYCGTWDRVGTADFVFNKATIQPGCRNAPMECSHVLIPYLYIEGIINHENFIARRCNNWRQFSSCACNDNQNVTITFPPDTRANGIYYLRTHAKSPFGMGNTGSRCHRHANSIIRTENSHYYSKNLRTNTGGKELLLEEALQQNHYPHLKDSLNKHLINGINKMEDFNAKTEGDTEITDKAKDVKGENRGEIYMGLKDEKSFVDKDKLQLLNHNGAEED